MRNLAIIIVEIVELWRKELNFAEWRASDQYREECTRYDQEMTELCNEFLERCEVNCNTVSGLAPLEEWYDTLDKNEIACIKAGTFNGFGRIFTQGTQVKLHFTPRRDIINANT